MSRLAIRNSVDLSFESTNDVLRAPLISNVAFLEEPPSQVYKPCGLQPLRRAKTIRALRLPYPTTNYSRSWSIG
jgi:hypothetical protein